MDVIQTCDLAQDFFEQTPTLISRNKLARAIDKKIVSREGAMWMIQEYKL